MCKVCTYGINMERGDGDTVGVHGWGGGSSASSFEQHEQAGAGSWVRSTVYIRYTDLSPYLKYCTYSVK